MIDKAQRMKREVRLQPMPKRFDGRKWEMEDREIVLVDSKAWVLVRRADSPTAMPYVVSLKEWNKFAVADAPERSIHSSSGRG